MPDGTALTNYTIRLKLLELALMLALSLPTLGSRVRKPATYLRTVRWRSLWARAGKSCGSVVRG